MKGVRGTDRRKYLIDMLRIFPRDVNYKDKEKESACVVREECIERFFKFINEDNSCSKM